MSLGKKPEPGQPLPGQDGTAFCGMEFTVDECRAIADACGLAAGLYARESPESARLWRLANEFDDAVNVAYRMQLGCRSADEFYRLLLDRDDPTRGEHG